MCVCINVYTGRMQCIHLLLHTYTHCSESSEPLGSRARNLINSVPRLVSLSPFTRIPPAAIATVSPSACTYLRRFVLIGFRAALKLLRMLNLHNACCAQSPENKLHEYTTTIKIDGSGKTVKINIVTVFWLFSNTRSCKYIYVSVYTEGKEKSYGFFRIQPSMAKIFSYVNYWFNFNFIARTNEVFSALVSNT